MKEITIYTDGACSCNPGPGGWACVLIYKDIQKELSGFENPTTNNRMELKAVIMALKQLKEQCQVNVYTDSAYVSNAFLQGWTTNWEKSHFKSSTNKLVQNIDLWQELINLCKIHSVTFHKVKGHADNKLNNLCDKLATGEIAKNTETIIIKSKK